MALTKPTLVGHRSYLKTTERPANIKVRIKFYCCLVVTLDVSFSIFVQIENRNLHSYSRDTKLQFIGILNPVSIYG